VARIFQPRTTGQISRGNKEAYPEIQRDRELFCEEWDQFVAQLIQEDMVHAVTEGEANPNPGQAGWGASTRQNLVFTWMSSHSCCALNNTMELQAAAVACLGLD
jgi:hypothetical protein